MTVTYAVRCETHQGTIHTMRRGFATREDAESHPVKLSLWKRVWVEPENTPVTQKTDPCLPPLPWNWVGSESTDARGAVHIYLVDANGRKIAAIWAGHSNKLLADFIIEKANGSTS